MAAELDSRLLASVLRLLEYPDSGRPCRVVGTRELVVSGTPYIAVYAVKAGSIAIIRVLHGAQAWPPGPR